MDSLLFYWNDLNIHGASIYNVLYFNVLYFAHGSNNIGR